MRCLTSPRRRDDVARVRLFFSVPVSEKARAAAAAVLRAMKRAAGEEAPLSWTKDDQLHFTIAFLGEQSEDALPRLREAAAACSELRAFELEERPFRGHLTAARVRPGGERSASRALQVVPPGAIATFKVDRLWLMQSQLSPHGAKHTLVYETFLS